MPSVVIISIHVYAFSADAVSVCACGFVKIENIRYVSYISNRAYILFLQGLKQLRQLHLSHFILPSVSLLRNIIEFTQPNLWVPMSKYVTLNL